MEGMKELQLPKVWCEDRDGGLWWEEGSIKSSSNLFVDNPLAVCFYVLGISETAKGHSPVPPFLSLFLAGLVPFIYLCDNGLWSLHPPLCLQPVGVINFCVNDSIYNPSPLAWKSAMSI